MAKGRSGDFPQTSQVIYTRNGLACVRHQDFYSVFMQWFGVMGFAFGATFKFSSPTNEDQIQWFVGMGNWTHTLTVTIMRGRFDWSVRNETVKKVCRLLLSRINRRIYGKHGTKRKGYRIASVAYLGMGAYGEHPHVHWALEKPPDLTSAQFSELISELVKSTKGFGKQYDIQDYFSERWISYMVDHGLDGWMEDVTFAAVCPKHKTSRA